MVDMIAVVLDVSLNLMLIPPLGALGAAFGTSGTLIAHNAVERVAGAAYRSPAVGPGLHQAPRGCRAAQAGSAVIGALATSLFVACAVTIGATLLLVRMTGATLEIDEMFPWAAGVPLLRPALGAPSASARGGGRVSPQDPGTVSASGVHGLVSIPAW